MLVSHCLKILIGHRIPIRSVVECHKSCQIHVPKNGRAQKNFRYMLFRGINRTVMFIAFWKIHGLFKGSGNVFPFSVDLFNINGSFVVKTETTTKLCIGHDIFLINEVHHVIWRNRHLEHMTTIWYKINFRAQNRFKCNLCRIIRKCLGFIIFVDRFMQKKGKIAQFRQGLSTELWLSAGIGEKIHQWLGTLVAEKGELLFFRTIFKEWFFRVASCCFYKILTNSDLP